MVHKSQTLVNPPVSVRPPVAQHLNEENASRDSVSIDVHKNAKNDSRSRLKLERERKKIMDDINKFAGNSEKNREEVGPRRSSRMKKPPDKYSPNKKC